MQCVGRLKHVVRQLQMQTRTHCRRRGFRLRQRRRSRRGELRGPTSSLVRASCKRRSETQATVEELLTGVRSSYAHAPACPPTACTTL